MPDPHPKTESLPPDLEKALREAGIDPDTDLPVLDPVPVSHASGPAEYQPAVDANIKRQWREWSRRRSALYDDYAHFDPTEAARGGTEK